MAVRLIIVFVATLLFSVIGLVFRVFAYDAYHFWSLNNPEHAKYSSNARVQNAAFINFLDFDSIILGNSHMENTSAKMASKVFGGQFFNLSMSGSNNYERSIVLKRTLETHDIKRVILLLTPRTSSEGHGGYAVESWDYLYDNNRFNDFKYYLNSHDLKCMWKFSEKSSCLGTEKDLDRPYAWYQYPWHSSRFGGIHNWAVHFKDPQLENLITKEIPEAATQKINKGKVVSETLNSEIATSLDQTVFDFVAKYPDTEFLLYFNPDSLLGKVLTFKNFIEFNTYASFVKQVAEKSAQYPNAHFFGFDNLPFTNDISFYKDPSHYTKEINGQLLKLMADRQYELTADNVDIYLSLLWKRMENFDLRHFNEVLQKELTTISK